MAGYSNGDVCLFRVDMGECIDLWTNVCGGDEVRWLRWSPDRPAVFFVLSNSGFLYIWDLLEDEGSHVDKNDLALIREGPEGTTRLPVIGVEMNRTASKPAGTYDLVSVNLWVLRWVRSRVTLSCGMTNAFLC